ncbi:unnamed protein product, partial [Ixodes pacificus]
TASPSAGVIAHLRRPRLAEALSRSSRCSSAEGRQDFPGLKPRVFARSFVRGTRPSPRVILSLCYVVKLSLQTKQEKKNHLRYSLSAVVLRQSCVLVKRPRNIHETSRRLLHPFKLCFQVVSAEVVPSTRLSYCAC